MNKKLYIFSIVFVFLLIALATLWLTHRQFSNYQFPKHSYISEKTTSEESSTSDTTTDSIEEENEDSSDDEKEPETLFELADRYYFGYIRVKVGEDMAREQFQTLTEPMYYILLALTEECCGVDIMEKVKAISHGRVLVGPGTLYAMLAKFEENGIIKMTTSEGRRKSYIITELGREMLQKEYDRLMIMVEDGQIYFKTGK